MCRNFASVISHLAMSVPTEQICAERFWSKVKIAAPGECWEWQASMNHLGYGQAWWGKKMRSCHRIAYELGRGSIPDGLHVLHTCDNRKCVNPAHLWLGTHKENMADMIAKGRRGTRSPLAKGRGKQIKPKRLVRVIIPAPLWP